MKKIAIILSLLFIALSTIQAQNYKSAVGARLGYPLSASYKLFLNESHAVEGFVGTRGFTYWRWTNVSIAYQIHKPFNNDNIPEGFQWYYGGGGSVYFWNWNTGFGNGENNTSFGVQGYIGLDYTFQNIPLNLSVDWVPTFFVNGFGSGFGSGFGAIAARYTLGK